jgi:hypothetical protein
MADPETNNKNASKQLLSKGKELELFIINVVNARISMAFGVLMQCVMYIYIAVNTSCSFCFSTIIPYSSCSAL